MKLLIADDEKGIRDGLREGIDWRALGFEEVYVAENGLRALEIYKECAPEVIITDIRMPGMDGLALSRRIREISGQARIVVLSGYSDFDYARQAIQSGVSDYELKPIKLKSLMKLAARLRDEVMEERKRDIDMRGMKQLKFIEAVLDGGIAAACDIAAGFELHWNVKLSGAIGLAMLETKPLPQASEEGVSGDGSPLYALGQRIMPAAGGVMVPRTPTKALLICPVVDEDMLARRLPRLVESCVEEMERRHGLALYVGMSGAGMAGDMPRLAAEAEEALAGQLLTGRSGMKRYLRAEAEGSRSRHLFVLNNRALDERIREGNWEVIEALIDEEFARLEGAAGITPALIRTLCLDFLNILLHALNLKSSAGDIDRLGRLDALEAFRQWVKETYAKLLEQAELFKPNHRHPTIVRALDYMGKHYEMDLTVDRVAGHVGITPNYFSHLFKKETGVTFSECLNKIRIGEAKKLLKQSGLMAYEITEKVGFANYKYFIQVFKKLEGVSPSQFRKSKQVQL